MVAADLVSNHANIMLCISCVLLTDLRRVFQVRYFCNVNKFVRPTPCYLPGDFFGPAVVATLEELGTKVRDKLINDLPTCSSYVPFIHKR